MSRLTETRPQRLNIAPSQMETTSDNASVLSLPAEDFEGKLVAAQRQLEQLQIQQEIVEQQKLEFQELNERKADFIEGQNDINDRFTTSLTAIDRELFEMRQEMEDLEQTRQCFAEHQKKINTLVPQSWSRDNLKQELTRSISILDHAEDEYEEAMQHFKNGRRSGVLTPSKKKKQGADAASNDFGSNFKQGLAFNLPLIIAAIAGYLIFLVNH